MYEIYLATSTPAIFRKFCEVELANTEVPKLNDFRKKILKEWVDIHFEIYKLCKFETYKLRKKKKIGEFRMDVGTELWAIDDEAFHLKILKIYKKVDDMLFDGEFEVIHFIKSIDYIFNKIVQSEVNDG